MSYYCGLLLLLLLSTAQASDEVARYANRCYSEALIHLRHGENEAARNAARKYVAFCRLRPELCSRSRIVEMTALTKPVPRPAPVPLPSPTPPPATRLQSRPRPPQRAPAPVIDTTRLKRTRERLVREAEQAREREQLEQSLRLYRLAEQAAPKTQEFEKPIQELINLIE